MIVCELNRIASHLIAFGTYGIDIGANTPFFYAFRERESIMALLERPSGARMLYNYIRPGGVAHDIDENWVEDVLAFCDVFEKAWKEYNTLLSHNAHLHQAHGEHRRDPQGHGPQLGRTRAGAAWLGRQLGPASRRALPRALRRPRVRRSDRRGHARIPGRLLGPLLGAHARDDGVDPHHPAGLCPRARRPVHRQEDREAIYKTPVKPTGEAYVRCENPRGELGFYVVAEGGSSPIRVHTRAPSFCNLSLLDALLPGTMIADGVAIIGSLDIVLGEVDR